MIWYVLTLEKDSYRVNWKQLFSSERKYEEIEKKW